MKLNCLCGEDTSPYLLKVTQLRLLLHWSEILDAGPWCRSGWVPGKFGLHLQAPPGGMRPLGLVLVLIVIGADAVVTDVVGHLLELLLQLLLLEVHLLALRERRGAVWRRGALGGVTGQRSEVKPSCGHSLCSARDLHLITCRDDSQFQAS